MLTYHRPAEVRRILPELIAQAGELLPAAEIVVIDNDPDGGAAVTVAEWAGPGVRYVHEPRPGIAAARNRALDEAAGRDVLVFIDDDEVPALGWLQALVARWLEWGCAAVAGPVESQFPSEPDRWIRASAAFARREHRTGDRVSGAATHNLLLDVAQVTRLGQRFDERLGLTGGEDTMFSHQLIDRGGEIRWCDEALVYEPVPAERLTRRWVLRRAYRAGTSWSVMELALAGAGGARVRARMSLLGRGAANLGSGAVALALGYARRDVAARARAMVRVASYAGLVTGTFGARLAEYGRGRSAS